MGVAVVLLASGCGRIGFGVQADGIGSDAGGDGGAGGGFSHLVSYANQTCALYGGRAYCWGNSADGQTGTGSFGHVGAPAEVVLPAGMVDDISPGENHLCAIVDGALYCAGNVQTPAISTPVLVPMNVAAKSVSAGRDFTCMLADFVYCWGFDNGTGQQAMGDTAPRTSPSMIFYNGNFPLAGVRSGDDHACAVDTTGDAFCWGHNDDGTLGTGSMMPASSLTPVAVTGNVHTLPQIAGWHACALDAGTVQCWGEGDHGEIGDNMMTSTATPSMVPSVSGASTIAVGGGPSDFDASCAIVAGGVSCWGAGQFGRLGNGGGNSGVPVDVAGLPGPAVSVAIGYDHACALLADGDVWCWGRGDLGQLGDGNMQSSTAPVRVTSP